MTDLEKTLAGRKPLILAIQDLPEPGQITYLLELGQPVNATVELDGYGPLQAEAVSLTRKQALSFAVRITEILGPLDSD